MSLSKKIAKTDIIFNTNNRCSSWSCTFLLKHLIQTQSSSDVTAGDYLLWHDLNSINTTESGRHANFHVFVMTLVKSPLQNNARN